MKPADTIPCPECGGDGTKADEARSVVGCSVCSSAGTGVLTLSQGAMALAQWEQWEEREPTLEAPDGMFRVPVLPMLRDYSEHRVCSGTGGGELTPFGGDSCEGRGWVPVTDLATLLRAAESLPDMFSIVFWGAPMRACDLKPGDPRRRGWRGTGPTDHLALLAAMLDYMQKEKKK